MRKALFVLVPIVALVIGAAWAQEKAPAVKKEAVPEFQYVGVAGCKTCHKSAKSGEQLKKWQEGPHAGAYATLATEESAAIAKKLADRWEALD